MGLGLGQHLGLIDKQLSQELGVFREGVAKAEEEGNKEGCDAVTQTPKGEKAIGASLSGRTGQGERPVWSYLR